MAQNGYPDMPTHVAPGKASTQNPGGTIAAPGLPHVEPGRSSAGHTGAAKPKRAGKPGK